ncbi:DUF4192 domain-containing protein [Streptomyces malaysiensis]|uniref:DUF4192 domain-containing protein n=1 Tax=Streptomyces malaysiensis subsp. samsunensis TaxID=459658 RepID=A0A9X2RTX9_STRMQ|nr:DUF4192 domain-containing protein [Streptomyces samsunensis]MCQ8830921.1 DUF4192 domain-containing protein [Streptomyces samsunensis]
MTRHNEAAGLPGEEQVTLRSPAELADALPYVLGFQPDDSIVMIALHGSRGRFGGRLRLGIPRVPEEWPEVCDQLAECLISGCERRGGRPEGVVLFLCQEPAEGESGQEAMERLRPLAQRLRIACGGLDVPVFEALCISGGRFWSYVCPDRRCCPPEGVPLALPGTSVMAAAATFAGVQVRGSLREMEARLAPLGAPRADGQERALDAAGVELVPRILDGGGSATVRAQTLGLLGRMLDEFQAETPVADACTADLSDDGLLDDREAAAVIIGLQDRRTRDRVAGWMEEVDADAALRLWRALARRCVGSYGEHAAAPLTLAGWVAWSAGDELMARVAFGRALRVDPDYLFARLLHQACNEGVHPKLLRQCLRRESSDGVDGSERVDGSDGTVRADRADRADRAVHAAVHAELERLGDLAAAEPQEAAGAPAETVETAGPVESADLTEVSAPAGVEEPGEAEEQAEAEAEAPGEAEDRRERQSARERPGGTAGSGGKGGPAGAGTPGGTRRPEGRPRARRRTGGRGARSRR